MSSYFTQSVVSFDLDLYPWEYINDSHVELTYIDGYPFGLTGANEALYSAQSDRFVTYRLKREDDSLPTGGIYREPMEWTGRVTLEGWAEDEEEIKNVSIRFGDAYQVYVNQWHLESDLESPHRRPFHRKTHWWHAEIDCSEIPPGSYTMKVIAEDTDGDFSILHEEQVDVR